MATRQQETGWFGPKKPVGRQPASSTGRATAGRGQAGQQPAQEMGWFGPKKPAPKQQPARPAPKQPAARQQARPASRGSARRDAAREAAVARAAAAYDHPDADEGELDELAQAELARTGQEADGGAEEDERGGGIPGRVRAAWRRERATHIGGGPFKRNRAQLAPHAAALLLWLAGGIVSAQAGPAAGSAVVTGLAAGLLAAGGLWVLRRRGTVPRGWRAWTTGLIIAAAGLAGWISEAGWSWNTLAGLLAVDIAFGTRWWARVRHPIPQGPPRPAAPAPNPPSPGRDIPARWRDTLGAEDGVLSGSRLVNGQTGQHAESYTLQLRPGRQTVGRARGLVAEIASGLRVPVDELVIEPHPDRDPSQARLQVLTSSPIKEPVLFRGPQMESGAIVLGPYADGAGQATFRLYSHKSMWGGQVTGGTGSGKSRLLEGIGLAAMAAGQTYVIHVDGQDGQSCPALWARAPERAGRDEVPAMLDRLEAIQRHRQKSAAAAGKSGFAPSPDYPGILVIVDEAHVVITRDTVKRWSGLARECRKVGISLVMADQNGSLKTYLEDPLRDALQAGNNIGLHTDSRTAGQILSSNEFNLRDLPADMPGYAYLLAAKDAGMRSAPFRAHWLPDADDRDTLAAAGTPLPEEIATVEDWFATTPCVALDAESDRAGGQRLDTHQQQAEPEAPHREHVGEPEQTPAGPAPGAGIGLPLPTVVPAPGTAGPGPEQPAAAAGESTTEARPVLSQAQADVAEALDQGATSPTQVIQATGFSKAHTHRVLGELVEAGYAIRTGRGTYTTPGQQTEQEVTA